MKSNYTTMAVLIAKEGKRKELQRELLKLIEPTRKEEGCLEYILFENKNKPGTFYMRETFKDYPKFLVHGATAHFKSFIVQANELMAEAIHLIELEQI